MFSESQTSIVPAPMVSVVIVNYNGLAFFPELLGSLGRAFSRHTSEIIVVDNASSDGSVQWLRQRADIRLISLAVNTGFTGGNNIGAAQARGHVLLLLNADTTVQGSLDELVDRACRNDIGAVGCQLRYGDGRLQHSIGLDHSVARITLSWLGLERRAGLPSIFRKCEIDPGRYTASHEDIAWVSGACLATRRDVWARLGGLDPAFFMYCEDVDYCERVRKLGLKVAYVAESLVTHYEASGKEWVGVSALLRTARAYQIYAAKTRGRLAARTLCSLLGVVFLLRSAAFGVLATGRPRLQQKLGHDRSRGYLLAARSLFGAALTGRTPALP